MTFKEVLDNYDISDYKVARVVRRRKGKAVCFDVLDFGNKDKMLKQIEELPDSDVMLIPPFKEEEEDFLVNESGRESARFLREYYGW